MSEVNQIAAAWALLAFAASVWVAVFLHFNNRFHTWDRVREAVQRERTFWERRFEILQRQIDRMDRLNRRTG